MSEQPTVMGMKVGWSDEKIVEFKKDIEFRMMLTDDDGVDHDILNLIDENKLLRLVNDGQAIINSRLRGEIEVLKALDGALKDFSREILKKELEDMAREGFEEVITSRQPRSYR